MTATHRRIHPGWWTAVLIAVVVIFMWLCSALFAGGLRSRVLITVTADRAGLVMESGAKVKMRGVEVGRVAGVEGGQSSVRLQVELFPDQVKHIPANTQAQIRANTIFGAKYVDLIYPDAPSHKAVSAGAVLWSRNVSTEVNTVFQSVVDVLHQVDPPKLNATLTAIAEAVRGRGERMGRAVTDTNRVLLAVNPRMDTVQADWRALTDLGEAYGGGVAQNILATLDAASTTSTTITDRAADLDALLFNVIGFSQAGIDLVGPSKDNFVRATHALEPTTSLLIKYSPSYTCLLMGAKWWLDNGADIVGGNGYSVILDDAFLLADDPYRYPDNLPIVAAKGGPGGAPGCGSLPDVSKNYPVRQLVTNTGWGTGLDLRPNPGIGFPGWADFFPVTRAVPEPPVIRNLGPPAPGPIPYPGAPPYGAPLYPPPEP